MKDKRLILGLFIIVCVFLIFIVNYRKQRDAGIVELKVTRKSDIPTKLHTKRSLTYHSKSINKCLEHLN